ncbi:transcriptional regulator, HxlR family [Chitinophaga sp. YR627]|uniref:winged helix-turn-helix transcriptional regulator n=1 Tax=Chitinophaga sp. YR627 TaxID=1881041 RepID=UPI0008F2DF49|nr:helix-turn-helix domain-containing protein [Chitinophaga sp. YR627]SFP00577.1 transcriptional regulator, HxlR family [Chitinophaga sp. YR627]
MKGLMSDKAAVAEVNTGEKCSYENSQDAVRSIRDAFDAIQGRWTLPILISLAYEPKRFMQLSRDIPGISDKILSRELKQMEMNQLLCRTSSEEFSSVVEYALTQHGRSVEKLMKELKTWGDTHRKQILGR